jgi:hypothetical protein
MLPTIISFFFDPWVNKGVFVRARNVLLYAPVWHSARQAACYKSNIEARSRNLCCCVKEISITYSECVFVALGIQHAMRMRRIAICGLYSIFLHCQMNGTIFGKIKVIEHEMCVLIFCTIFAWNIFSISEGLSETLSQIYLRLHVKYQLLLSDFNET